MKAAIFLLALLSFPIFAQSVRSITILTEPQAKVWVNQVYRGETDNTGRLTINLPRQTIRIRVRAYGFKELSKMVGPSQTGNVKFSLVRTTDKAELAFQQAEKMSSVDRERAVELYREAVSLKPNFAEAYVAMARVLSEMGETEEALEAIKKARRIKPVYPEASAVEGRIYKSEGSEEKAIAAFNRAIKEGRGFQPEAYAGLGLLYKERAESLSLEGKFDEEKLNYELAAKALRTSINQLSGAPDAEALYQVLGLIYEKQGKYPQAIKTYEEFLRVFPESSERSAVESFITQLKKKITEKN
ncbi:MAG: tetratricopeptide repeat protein [Acidobacteriota bacterium]|nr:tetratricopeptide repeat protein [Acidobacteriota bacterium]